jgi:hypothetical protein
VEEKEAPKEKTRRRGKKTAQGVVETLDDAIENIRKKLKGQELKGSIGDLVRLLQLRQELTDTQAPQVTVRWVDQCQAMPANEE